ncbi:NAD-dependent epimerase/dehydratase family protein [Pseudactinotalea suaedae]|uniref:NAD-dependent epimerase/dehydratase family protein n=1 Tax=Pseudactinotalea suaedae TaxID=1524924 RepID=UPI0012E1E9CB|nr:NAD-dependent epimerase/dehydratase family protein [Pseudactinotalea suaedae]
MRVVVIGGSGHIGTFLVPRLVRAGHEVVNVSRGTREPYLPAPEWEQVRQVVADRQREDEAGTWGETVRALEADVVVDLVCFTLGSATALVEALRGNVDHLLHCGSIWRHGPSRKLPIAEGSDAAEPPVDEYGVEKERIARMLKEETAAGGLVTTSLHPGHISGPGWHPIGPLGNLDPGVWTRVSQGGVIEVPGSGTEAMHHVHADDVAQAFERAIERRDAAAGEDFSIVAPTALTVRGYLAIAAGWFGRTATPVAVGWERFRELTPPDHAEVSWNHLHRNHVMTIDKARTLLGYAPRYEPEAAVLEAVRWLVDHGELEISGPLVV